MRKRDEFICFGIETAGNTSKDAAQGINHSLKLFEYTQPSTQLKFNSSTADAGGGGTSESLVREFEAMEHAVLDFINTWVNCVFNVTLFYSVQLKRI